MTTRRGLTLDELSSALGSARGDARSALRDGFYGPAETHEPAGSDALGRAHFEPPLHAAHTLAEGRHAYAPPRHVARAVAGGNPIRAQRLQQIGLRGVREPELFGLFGDAGPVDAAAVVRDFE